MNTEQKKESVQMAHTQLEGVAFFDKKESENGKEIRSVLFSPDKPLPDNVEPYHGPASVQIMRDGTIDIVASRRIRHKVTQIEKLPHGRVSETFDEAVILTLKVFKDEGVDIAKAIKKEAEQAASAVKVYLAKQKAV